MPPRRVHVVPLVALSLITTGLAVPAVASPSHPGSRLTRQDPAAVALAPGVTIKHVSTWSDGAPEQVTLLGIDLATAGVAVDAASPGGTVGDARATVRSQTNARHALAGVNADFFDLENDNASPRGVLVSSGTMLKSPTAPRNANLVIRRTKAGTVASVGAVPFTGRVVRIRKGAHNLARSLTTVNSLVSARAGGLSLLTASMAPSSLTRSCALATGTITRGVWSVSSVRTSVRSTPAFTSATWGLLSCRGNGASWIGSSLRRGDTVEVTRALAGGTPWAAVSGGSVLVRNGKAWHDPEGEHLPYTGRNAETFACVARSGRRLTLATIDGYTRQSAGVTYRELTSYMLTLSNCWSGVVFDGGGSTTLVARMPGSSKATVQNVPADHPARQVADTLVVFGK